MNEGNRSTMKYTLFLLVLLTVGLAGCNIFSWSSNKGESHLERGLELMRQGNYEEAEAEFAQSMADDPVYADARYHHAKAVLYGASFDIIDLMQAISQDTTDRKEDNAALPLYSRDIVSADEMYRVNLIIIEDLNPIYVGDTHGTITTEDIEVDLAIAYLIAAITGLRDTNRDGTITEDDLLLEIQYAAALGSYSITRLDQFLGGGVTLLLPNTDGTSISPDQINPLIDYVLSLINNSKALVTSVLQELTGETNVEAIQELIDDIEKTIVKYRYDDGEDNDKDGRIDEEILNGLDDDGDGYHDEDTAHV